MSNINKKMEDIPESSKNLFSFSAETNTAVFSMSKLIRLFVILTILSFYLNLFLGCTYVFNCSNFTPSPHYLGSFLGYNRFYVMSFTLLTITVGLMYIGISLEFSSQSNRIENIIIKGVGYFTCISLPIIALTNEVNSTHFVNFSQVYLILSYSILIFNLIWLYVVYKKIRKTTYSDWEHRFSIGYFAITTACYAIVLIQRNMNYKVENWFINTSY